MRPWKPPWSAPDHPRCARPRRQPSHRRWFQCPERSSVYYMVTPLRECCGDVAFEGPMTQSIDDITAPALRIGSRGSPLALVQAREVQSRLATACGLDRRTDRDQGDPDHRRRDPGPAVGRSRRQRAVHQGDRGGACSRARSTSRCIPQRTCRPCCRRGSSSRRSCRAKTRAMRLSAAHAKTLRDLPSGAVVGTASLRRQALVKHLRPDLKIVPLRGNVETRLRKLEAGDFDATVLAVAGLKRLGLLAAATSLLDAEEFVPAVGQGAIGIETRDDDAKTRRLSPPSTMPTPRPRLRPSAPSLPCSMAPAARRSAATRALTATPFAFAA